MLQPLSGGTSCIGPGELGGFDSRTQVALGGIPSYFEDIIDRQIENYARVRDDCQPNFTQPAPHDVEPLPTPRLEVDIEDVVWMMSGYGNAAFYRWVLRQVVGWTPEHFRAPAEGWPKASAWLNTVLMKAYLNTPVLQAKSGVRPGIPDLAMPCRRSLATPRRKAFPANLVSYNLCEVVGWAARRKRTMILIVRVACDDALRLVSARRVDSATAPAARWKNRPRFENFKFIMYLLHSSHQRAHDSDSEWDDTGNSDATPASR